MQQLSLIAPTLAWEDEIVAYRQETLARDGHINGGGRLDQYERVSDWLAWLEQMSSAATCGAGITRPVSQPSIQAAPPGAAERSA